jgi:hypothetical protein
MIEVFEDGQLKWTISDVGSSNDIVILPKQMAESCTMTYDGFSRIYYANVSGSNTNNEAYEKAEKVHIQYFGKRKYSDYDSFRNVRDRNYKNGSHT